MSKVEVSRHAEIKISHIRKVNHTVSKLFSSLWTINLLLSVTKYL